MTDEELIEALRDMCALWEAACLRIGWDPGVSKYANARSVLVKASEAERRQELRDRFRSDDQQDRLREMRDERFI